MGVALLVRHGQASFGTDDYDVLSPAGEAQAATVGAALSARDITPSLVVAGSMRRHQQTAAAAMSAAGWDTDLRTEAGWDEFDHQHVLDVYPERVPAADLLAPRGFHSWFERATGRWTSGDFDADYRESFTDFTTRVDDALLCLQRETGPGVTSVVFTSGGTIGWVAASLLAAGPEQWRRLNRVAVNTGVTTIAFGSSGAILVGFNDHAHLPKGRLTYR